ncbi:hypothetical protein DLAC_04593 [Tieghemostelium lacteum]|uniref:Tyrosine-protein kinase ephrin type A/B receptor-like domain-containing protein n=1 Tax=Tieghemostelium lacteum TaxID=361077 RepID=A0A151ZJY7_TIELA|nr:hypothetical protein DLAC_04593 [Tieghemostelium lacteum]|eukprot:KYQ94293.1 hypothetical protein DLAC_04593 [Tieghemostelium lacteum]
MNFSDSIISSSLYNGYGLIGSNPNTKISFATLLQKENRSLPFSSNNQYQILHIFSDQSKQFGSSVALGSATYKHNQTTIGAITSPTESLVFLYDFDSCTKSQCEDIIQFSTDPKQQKQKNDDKSFCDIGSVAVGENFIVVQCLNNLLNPKTNSSAIAICQLDLDTSYNSCTNIKFWGNGTEILMFSNITCTKGQLYVTGMNTYNDKVIFTACGVCMNPEGNQIKVSYFSAFVELQIKSNDIVPIQFQVTKRNESCPSSIAMSEDWVAIGYPEEMVVDLYYLNDSNSNQPFLQDDSQKKFEYFKSVEETDSNGFGGLVNIGSHLLVVTASGDASQDISSRTYFYEIYKDENSSKPYQNGIEASIPNLNYKTPFEYGFSSSFYGDELLLLSQDLTLTRMGFTFFGVCPKGYQWTSQNCSPCPPGQYKAVSNTKANTSFELCYPCPKGYFTNNLYGIDSFEDCKINKCSNDDFCPDGSVVPQPSIPIESYSQSNPDPNSSEELDFESTFYNSCYPYFLIILGGTLLLSLSICLPWPCTKYHKTQNKIIKGLLKVNFYDWDGEEMTEIIEYEEPSLTSSSVIQINNIRASKRGIFVRKRRMAVKPVKAVESFCSYYFLIVFVLMCVFIFQFQQVNNDVTLELRPLGQASTVPDPTKQYSDAQYLKLIDSSPIIINIDLLGYSGDCQQSEISAVLTGCQKANYMGTCNYQLQADILDEQFNSSKHCRISLSIPTGVEYADETNIALTVSPTDYFYTQRILYNISTNNQPSDINTGNSFVYGVIQPNEGTILRPTASISILSMLTLVSDCKVRTAGSNVGLSLVRPMIDKCLYNPSSYKDFSQISNSSTYIRSEEYHDADPNFTFNIRLEKSVFYHYATSSHSVSFGEIVTVIMFAVLDVFWLIEVIVPVIQFIVSLFDEYFKNRKKREKNDENYEDNSEMSDLLLDQNNNKKKIVTYNNFTI